MDLYQERLQNIENEMNSVWNKVEKIDKAIDGALGYHTAKPPKVHPETMVWEFEHLGIETHVCYSEKNEYFPDDRVHFIKINTTEMYNKETIAWFRIDDECYLNQLIDFLADIDERLREST